MFLGETLEEEAFVMKNPNNIFIELSYDKFTELRKKGLVGLTIDNVGSINAAMLGISKSKALNPKRSRMKMRKINRIESLDLFKMDDIIRSDDDVMSIILKSGEMDRGDGRAIRVELLRLVCSKMVMMRTLSGRIWDTQAS